MKNWLARILIVWTLLIAGLLSYQVYWHARYETHYVEGVVIRYDRFTNQKLFVQEQPNPHIEEAAPTVDADPTGPAPTAESGPERGGLLGPYPSAEDGDTTR